MVDPMLAGSDSVSDGFMEKLETWVSMGNTLVYFAGSNYAAVSDSNIKNAGKFLPPANPTPNLTPTTIATENFPPVGWFNRFRSAPLNLINQSEFRKRVTFDTSKDYQTAALGYFSDNQPLAEMKQLRAGFITLLPWVPDLSYSDLPLRPSFVPFIQTLLSRILDTLNDAKNPIVILDFGSQYTQLIGRRIRELGVYCEIFSFNTDVAVLQALAPCGFILSGGPATVTEESNPRSPEWVFQSGLPLLGICYGMQTMAAQLGGQVATSELREFGAG